LYDILSVAMVLLSLRTRGHEAGPSTRTQVLPI
jgi:hypothetical protein